MNTFAMVLRNAAIHAGDEWIKLISREDSHELHNAE